MSIRRVLAVAALTGVSLVLAACGAGTSGGPRAGSVPEGASLVRSGATAFVAIDSDLGSRQWRQVDELAKKFPGRDDAVARLEHTFSKQGLDFDRDVKPALGPEVDVAFGRGAASSSDAVVLTKPGDAGKLKALVAKANAHESSGERAVYREVNGWYAVAYSQAAIDAALAGVGTPLSENADFKAALGKLPGDALLKAYIDGAAFEQLAPKSAPSAASLGLDTVKYLAVSLSAESQGVRLRGAASGGNLGGGDFASKLVGSVPADALALLSFQGVRDQLQKLTSTPQAAQALAQVRAALGVSVDELLALFRGEAAFYVRPSVGIPELTLALRPEDPSAALATLDKIAGHLASRLHANVEAGTQDGHPVKTISFGRFAVHYGSVDGTVLVTSGPTGIADFGSGDALPDSADFKEAKDAAGMPDSTGGIVYVDLKDALPLLEGLATLSGHGLSNETSDNLRPLRSFLAWSSGSPGSQTFDAFLEIK